MSRAPKVGEVVRIIGGYRGWPFCRRMPDEFTGIVGPVTAVVGTPRDANPDVCVDDRVWVLASRLEPVS